MKKLNWMIGSGLIVLTISGCATREKISGTSVVPAAQGQIKASKAEGNNTDLQVKVSHLAQPQRVASGATNYVVWIQPEGARSFQNIGILQVGRDLEGQYETTIPYRDFRIVVTPEPSGAVVQPSGPAVFDQFVSRR